MAFVLDVLLQCSSESEAKELGRLLKEDSRPDFDDEVDPQWQKHFQLIEEWDYPEAIQVKEDLVFVEWEEVELELSYLEDALTALSINILAAFTIVDDPLSEDEFDIEVEEHEGTYGSFYVQVDDNLVCINQSNLESLFPDKKIFKLDYKNSTKTINLLGEFVCGKRFRRSYK